MLSSAAARAATPRRLLSAPRRAIAATAPGDRPPPGDPQASDPVTDPTVRTDGGPSNEKNQVCRTPARYAASKLVSNTAFFAKGARLVVKSVADRVSGRSEPRPSTTSEPAGAMQDTNDTAGVKYATLMRDEAAARKATGHKQPLTSAYPETGAAARAAAGLEDENKEKK